MRFDYIRFQSGVGNRYVIQLHNVVSVKAINSNRAKSNIKILTADGNEYTAIEAGCSECNRILDEYMDWLNTLDERSSSKCFDFIDCLTRLRVRIDPSETEKDSHHDV